MHMQEVGVENMFTFGVDAEEVDQLREDRKNFKDYDPRWVKVMDMLKSGKFGDKEYFAVRPVIEHLIYHFHFSTHWTCLGITAI